MSNARTLPTPTARPVTPKPVLRLTGGAHAGKVLVLDHEDGTLGRRCRNTYTLADPHVSRVHARVACRAGSVVLSDLGSSSGTRVNGEPLRGSRVLHHGDEVAFGPVTCRFEDPAAFEDGDEVTLAFAAPEVVPARPRPRLSARQEQVLALIADGLTNAAIGRRLGIAERTVKAYAAELYDRLGVGNRAGAVGAALRFGLL